MSLDDDTIREGSSSLGLVAAACVLALGLGAGGYFMAKTIDSGLGKLRAKPHEVTVKGLAERSVKADLALWPLRFVATGNDMAELQTKLDNDQKSVVEFLKAQGLPEDEVIVGRRDVVDLMAREYRGEGSQNNRFILYANLMIRSGNIDLAQQSSRKIGDLVKSGVVFTTEGPGSPASLSPYFLFTKLNDVKLEMISEATRNARAAATQFASDAAVPLGPLTEANQGVFSILPGDQFPGASEETQVNKTLRVVSTVAFGLAN